MGDMTIALREVEKEKLRKYSAGKRTVMWIERSCGCILIGE